MFSYGLLHVNTWSPAGGSVLDAAEHFRGKTSMEEPSPWRVGFEICARLNENVSHVLNTRPLVDDAVWEV